MPYTANVFRVMIASPSDVTEPRLIAQDVIAEWNSVHADDRGIVLLPLSWERDSTPLQGDRPQSLINDQVLAKSDVLVAIFWGRIGSPTGQAVSGTVEEIERHMASGKPTLIYYSKVPMAPDSFDAEQMTALREFRARIRNRGIQWEFSTPDEFRQLLTRNLASLVVEHAHFKTAPPQFAYNVDPQKAEREAAFKDVESLMPELISEMRQDLSNDPTIREFFAHEKGQINAPGARFFYFPSKHPKLESFLQMLENLNFIEHVARDRNTRRFRFTEPFATMLRKKKE
jgi:hypothetical protein